MTDKKDINMAIGANIKREREKAGYTQERFSELIGLGAKSLSAVERGTVGISISALMKICKVLSISSDTLLFGITAKNDIDDLVLRLERLSPDQCKIVSNIVYKVLEAFYIQEKDHS